MDLKDIMLCKKKKKKKNSHKVTHPMIAFI